MAMDSTFKSIGHFFQKMDGTISTTQHGMIQVKAGVM